MAIELHSASAIPALPSVELKAHAADLFNIDAALTEEERSIRDTIRKFVDERVLPIIGECYVQGRFPDELVAEMAELGKQSRALQRERPKVRAAGDAAAIADLEARIKDLDRRYVAIRRAHEESVQPRIMEITKRFVGESEGQSNVVRVTVESNGGKVSMRADGDPALAAEIIH